MTIKKNTLRFEMILLSLICLALTCLTTCSSVFEANGQIPQGSHFNKLFTFSLQNAKALGKSDPRYFVFDPLTSATHSSLCSITQSTLRVRQRVGILLDASGCLVQMVRLS
jgi:hypothetical protein